MQSTTVVTPDRDLRPHTNGHHYGNGEEDAPPAKKRRLNDSDLQRRKLESPPWKKIAAEGPSSFTQNGIRKSGRTNQIPLELQPPSDKRQTRGAVQRSNPVASKYNSNLEEAAVLGPKSSASSTHGRFKDASLVKQHDSSSPKSPLISTASIKRSRRISTVHNEDTNPQDPSVPLPNSIAPHRIRHLPRTNAPRSDSVNDVIQNEAISQSLGLHPSLGTTPRPKLSRIKFRLKPAVLPLAHPGLIPDQKRRFADLASFLGQGSNVLVEKGGLFHPEDGLPYTPESITKDAQIILRLEGAVEIGGPLNVQSCSVYQPDEPEHPSEQYGHRDHLLRAAAGLRKLMIAEQRKHQGVAKRLAELCKDEWFRRQPKTSEELDAEQADAIEIRYRSVVKSLQATWENARAEVNRRKLVEWEAQEQARVRKALNNAVDVSTQKLQARRAHGDSDTMTDDEVDIENPTMAGSDMDANVSSSGSDNDNEIYDLEAIDDEYLTVEQLQAKYAAFPGVVQVQGSSNEALSRMRPDSHVEDPEDMNVYSDDSVNMDDDLGESEDPDSDNEMEDDSGDDGEPGSDHQGPSSLLGFLTRAELRSLTQVKGGDPPSGHRDRQMSNIHDSPHVQNHVGIGDESYGSDEDQAMAKGTPGTQPASADHSSEVTPKTTDTKSSDADSASSVELHETSRHSTHSATPQPLSPLKTPIPSLLRGILREYQHYGLDWLAGLYANKTNGILADEMGLGKTIQTIALLAHLACEHQVWGPHLVIVPTSVMLNWEMEFKKWCPGFKILTYYGTQEERKRKRLGWKSEDVWNVCITSYQLVLQDQQVFKRRRWHYMILDEAHNIKNFQSQRWQTMLTFNTRARLLLTGTPLQNNLTELWSLLYFLMPSDGAEQGVGGFANLKEFQDWFKKPSEQILEHGRDKMDDESRAIITKLHKVLRPYLLRRLKADVEKQMPGKHEHVELCRLSKRQRELYDSFLSREDTRGTLASGNYLSIINCLMQLRKVCNHPDLFLDRPILTSLRMKRSVAADFGIKDLLIRRRLVAVDPMSRASLDFLNLIPTKTEDLAAPFPDRSAFYTAQRLIISMREAQRTRAQQALTHLDSSTIQSNLCYLENASRWARFEELQHCVYLNALRRQQRPIYGDHLVRYLTLGLSDTTVRPFPRQRSRVLAWLEDTSPSLAAMVPSLSARAGSLQSTIQRFACVTPAVVTRDMTSLALTPEAQDMCKALDHHLRVDPFHESRMRLSVQFPDKRLLQFDCGKLQTLDKLLRKLQAGGHRALIFTQMTKVLDILERFLNIHGHKYLRLDGATKIEQRQILTDRFNNDTRILAFILSSRSGGLGINLTGADTVIFYDLDWNPAMDKQCQDRCHRIGQTRDVHIYRLISEHTIEANILRKANQKRMLDDVVIQEGEFTTDYFNRIPIQGLLAEQDTLLDGDAAANAAMDRVLGGSRGNNDVCQVLAQAEDKEDVAAATAAECEMNQTDAADFDESIVTATTTTIEPMRPIEITAMGGSPVVVEPSVVQIRQEDNVLGGTVLTTDNYMLCFIASEFENAPAYLAKDRLRSR